MVIPPEPRTKGEGDRSKPLEPLAKWGERGFVSVVFKAIGGEKCGTTFLVTPGSTSFFCGWTSILRVRRNGRDAVGAGDHCTCRIFRASLGARSSPKRWVTATRCV